LKVQALASIANINFKSNFPFTPEEYFESNNNKKSLEKKVC